MFTKVITLLVLFIGCTSIAHATFHSWEINELYTNADGSIQFIELFEAKGDDDSHELFTDNAQMSCTSSYGLITHLMASFPNDLPSNLTVNKFFLITTTGFAGLDGAVTPYYSLTAYKKLVRKPLEFRRKK